MKAVVSALLVLSLVLIVGCTNDDDTINPITKYHDVYPIFHLKIDNGFRQFGVDSVMLTVSPDIGWTGPVYSDVNGFIGTLADGTFIDFIDTIPDADTVIYDTSWVVFGFAPSTTYNFSFSRGEPFLWQDSFRAIFAITVDSSYLRFSIDTFRVTRAPDPARPPETVLYRVQANPPASLQPPPDDTIMQNLLVGYWSLWYECTEWTDDVCTDSVRVDSAFIIANPDDTVNFPPDSTRDSTVLWGLWHKIDSFFLPPDSAIWCDTLDILVVEDTILDQFNQPLIVTDTSYVFGNCDARIDTVQNRVYSTYGWGVYPGGDQSATPIPSYDTILHFTFPDTLKQLVFDNGALSILSPVIDPVSHDTLDWETKIVEIQFKHQGSTQTINNMSLDLTLPPVEVFPQYDFIIRQTDK
jgi:hypothetical protein